MIKLTADIIGVSPLSFSKAIVSQKETGENPDVFEERTWRERMHVDERGELFIPPNALKNMLSSVARYLAESVPGKGKATYTKNFEAGLLVVEPLKLGIKADSTAVIKERLFVPSDGKKGGGKRVYKSFPTVLKWETKAEILVFDPLLIAKPEKIEEYLRHAGKFIGFLRFRPRQGGYYGRFNVKDFKVIKD